MLTSETSGGATPTYTIYTGGGVNYLTLRVQFYANECDVGVFDLQARVASECQKSLSET